MTDPVPTDERASTDRTPTGRRQHASVDVAPELYDAGAAEPKSAESTAQRAGTDRTPATDLR
ncbi:hypothetical protein [Halobellus sp. GM3]|uniref:hypothetical protein n=1 Tax=Halobellus sp. GM3 TaxID=3458410 RepID=UPI00403E02E2